MTIKISSGYILRKNVSRNIEIDNLTAEQRRKFAIVANKAEKRRRFKALLRKKRMDLKKPIVKKHQKTVRLTIWSIVCILSILWMFFMNIFVF